MQIIDASWEKRNLGQDVLEIVLDSDDSKKNLNCLKDELLDCIKLHKASYVVMKFDSKDRTLLQLPFLCGFSFSETQLLFCGVLKSALIHANNVLRGKNNFYAVPKSSAEDFNFIATEIKKGLFKTDRIALDPEFGVEIANVRYANWLLDLKNSQNRLLSMVYMNKKPIGYELATFNGCEISAIHGGLLSDYQKLPIGLMEMASLVVSYEPNFKTHFVTVSSNNLPVIRGWQYFGYQITAINNVFVKHLDCSK